MLTFEEVGWPAMLGNVDTALAVGEDPRVTPSLCIQALTHIHGS